MLSPRYWTFLVIVLAAVAYSMYTQFNQPTVIVSPADPYTYRYLKLENGMKALLVSTPGSKKAAAAVSVEVGSGDDPKERQGLAHFLEHMLFLGTEPYPEAGEYQAYISRHGGSHNAFTAHAQTTYFFDINNADMQGALDRFAPFFISPRFDAQYVERERNAVHAEYKSKYKDDFRRIYSAEKLAMNPNHPYASFATGSLDTLSDRDSSSIRDELLDFYKQHYSSDRMTLVLAGDYSLDQLQQWAQKHFSAVPERLTTVNKNTQPLFSTGQLPLDLNIEPVKEIRRLQFTFPLPPSKTLYEYKPVQVLSNLIGHEGEGSLLAFLKKRGWAETLSAGRSLATDNETVLVVQINLTQKGLLYKDQITQALMHYIDLMKQAPLPEYLTEEQAQLSEISFRFQEHGRLSDYAVRLSSNLLVYSPENTIYGDYKWLRSDPSKLTPFLDALNADNMLRTLIAPYIETDTTDPWYDTNIRLRPGKYSQLNIQTSGLNELHLPEANPFIPQDFALHASATQNTPVALISEPQRSLWYYGESEFKQPKAQIRISLEQSVVQASAHERLLAKLYARTINEALNTYSYPAYLTGLSYNLSATGRGLQLQVGGYQDKLPELLARILKEMQHIELDNDAFNRYKNSLQRALQNQLKGKPYQRTLEALKHWLYDPSFNPEQLLAELETVTREDVIDYSQRFAAQLAQKIYVHGSVNETQAREMAELVNEYFPAGQPLLTPAELVKAPVGIYQQQLQLDHQDKAVTLYIQGPNNSDRERATFSLLAQILSAPYYQYMRTEQQLGYIVFAAPYPQQTVPALAFIVQSPDATPEKIMRHSETFFNQFKEKIATLNDTEFNSFKQGLINLLSEKPKNMAEKASRFWRELEQQRYDFDTMTAIAAEVETLTLKDVQTLYQRAIVNKQLPWLVFTQGGHIDNATALIDVNRKQLPRFTLPEYGKSTAIVE